MKVLLIRYQMTNEQAQGIIAKRDFVNITTRRYIDDEHDDNISNVFDT